MKKGFYGENAVINNIPGNYGLPIIGSTFHYLIDVYKHGKKMKKRYGRIYKSSAFFQKFIVLSSPEGIEFVLKDPTKNFSSKLGWEPFLGRLFPNALPTMDFGEHRNHRQIMQSVFTTKALSSYCQYLNEVVEADTKNWIERRPLKVYDSIKELTLNIGAKVFLGINLGENIDFINTNFAILNDGLAPIIPYPVPGLAIWKAQKAKKKLFDFFRPMIDERRKMAGPDIFSRLCLAKSEDGQIFTEQQILDHLVNVLSAAHDTTTTSLTIVMHYLILYPEWQERLRKISQEYPSDDIQFEDLDNFKEHEWVFNEAIRIYPPAPSLFRRSIEECEFEGHTIPANTQVLLDVGCVHRSEDHWTDPMKFDPLRFSPSREEHKKHLYQWVPFGGGAHLCIGNTFAIMLIKIILHKLLRKYKFSRDPNKKVKFIILPITRPIDGLKVEISEIIK
jgi:cytochrome P450